MNLSLYCKGSKRLFKVCVWEGAGDRTKTAIFWPPHSYGRQRCVFLVLLMLNRGPWGLLCWVLAFFTASYQHLLSTPSQSGLPRAPSAGCGFPYPISSNSVSNSTATATRTVSWLSYIIVQRPLLLVSVTIALIQPIHSQGYNSDIPRPDAPVIYIGEFPILTARPGRRSIYNIRCNCYRLRKWKRRHQFESLTRLSVFPIALIFLGKVSVQLFSLQLWAKSWADWNFFLSRYSNQPSRRKTRETSLKKLTFCYILILWSGWVKTYTKSEIRFCLIEWLILMGWQLVKGYFMPILQGIDYIVHFYLHWVLFKVFAQAYMISSIPHMISSITHMISSIPHLIPSVNLKYW